MKRYEECIIQILTFCEDVVRCSNTYDVGDDTKEDIFD